MANDIVNCIYVDNLGNEYRYRMNAEVLAQLDGGDPDRPKVGGAGVGPANTLQRLPSSVKPRRILMESADGTKQRTQVILDPEAALWGASPPTLNLEDSDGVSTTYSRKKKHEEDFGRG